ncbi:PREDICTED: ribosome biogenesis protein BMS1 homolog [Nicrophorus vespilloides]|uniref:Ribosome biogenesis protein BMS1 homolog n=1 Tax=Nicrophorus vespilloides TaxID=110193 RepID=A0ABM1N371_NICVS|nr:PREDICTED: ribosome biogenesis protein BMS1 homolog [Nicrophorus vespilloides]
MGEDIPIEEKKKSHREKKSGKKAERKKAKKDAQNPNVQELTDKQKNPKAFAINSAIRAERRFRRKQDIDTKKQHVPLVDRTPLEPPPILIAVVGPPKVGKTTLINNLIKMFTKSPLSEVKGPVTIVTGKKRRITLFECNNDINSMIDLAKVADLVLLLCDASFGFEMEIFEFLNICQVHGMPKIMGVLTHLDMIKNRKTLKNTKKILKHRFWTELYAGAKLFYLSGIVHGDYLKNEIKNLGRFISVMKFRPLTWRSTHSYLVGDRYEDLTNQEMIRKNPKCDRNVSLYGYIRGIPLSKNTMVHIAGFGDLRIHEISFLPDPCPLPEQIKKRALIEKEKFIYAPFSGVGGIVYDKDAVYVELGGSHSHKQRDEGDETNIVANLIETKETLDVKMEHSEMQLFTGGKTLMSKDMDVDESEEEEDEPQLYEKNSNKEDDELEAELAQLKSKQISNYKVEKIEDSGRIRRKVVFEESDDVLNEKLAMSEDDDEDEDNDDEEDPEEDDESSEDESVEESKIKPKTQPEYIQLKENKDIGIHSKITDVLKNLNTKKVSEKVSDSTKKVVKSKKEESESDDDDSSDDERNLSKIKAMKIDKFEEVEFDDESDNEDEEDGDDENDDEDDESDDEDSRKDNNSKNEDQASESESDDGEVDLGLKWKDNLAKKAEDAFFERQKSSKNLMKLVYGVFDNKYLKPQDEEIEEDSGDDEDNIGGLFKKISVEQQKLKMEKDKMDLIESTLFMPWNSNIRNWIDPENKLLITNRFVTGKWKESEDANELLKLDDAEDLSDIGSDVYGDFEDLETGEKFTAKTPEAENGDGKGEKRKRDLNDKDDMADRVKLAEKKKTLKEKFDADYDKTEKSTFYEELKSSAEKQAEINRSVFENMPDEMRVQLEGFRAGMYCRLEFQDVPCEFINNFDPTYPLVIGALNMVEENIGFVNVKVKKHRWYKKILKSNDPLIVSLGWRRFQTMPLYSKLEDDMKFRYLKYTPEHVTCNAHFWGPITPQGTGFIALQTCDGSAEVIKHQGFRIAATGVVQELDKSTQIMKKLKLIGYPMKIYKKTAFIKGMFNSSLEVAKFEGARIKTVSGIRGQIKKAASKPEGVFRASFEDKIKASDIIFCRTWYKVDVKNFYTPVNTLLLPAEQKNSWRGLRTTGEIKRSKGIQSQPALDSLYTEIERTVKPFKPLIIPGRLQKALPYKDKPKHSVKDSDKKKQISRVAVIREPEEQKVANMMKMLKASFEFKQGQLKTQTKERLAKYKKTIEDIEQRKSKKLGEIKKDVFRKRSKAELKAQKKANKK